MDAHDTWRSLISDALEEAGETWADVVSCTLDEAGLDRVFDSGFGSPEGQPFTLWTTRRVYFPLEYDGAESVGSASRDPDGKPTHHQC